MGLSVYDFDNTLTTTDTIKFAAGALLLQVPWKFFKVLSIYKKYKRLRATPETLKHAILGELIAGKSELWVSNAMKVFVIIVKRFRMHAVWKDMLEKRRQGTAVLIATASPQFAVEAVMKRYDIDVVGTRYEKKQGIYTGLPLKPISYGEGKLLLIQSYMAAHAFERITCTYSDSLSDQPVFDASEHGYLVDKNGILREYEKVPA